MKDSDNPLHIFRDPPFLKCEQLDLIKGLLHELYCRYEGVDEKLTNFIIRLCAETLIVQRGPFVFNDQFIELKKIIEHFAFKTHREMAQDGKEVLDKVALFFEDVELERVVYRGVKASDQFYSAHLDQLVVSMISEIKCQSCSKFFPKIRAVEIVEDCFRCPHCSQLIFLT